MILFDGSYPCVTLYVLTRTDSSKGVPVFRLWCGDPRRGRKRAPCTDGRRTKFKSNLSTRQGFFGTETSGPLFRVEVSLERMTSLRDPSEPSLFFVLGT